jgi:hypothetical protein
MIKDLIGYTETFNNFKKYLFIKVNKDEKRFKAFATYPVSFQLPYFIEFLELNYVPILEALAYYNTYLTNASYNDVVQFTIKAEFKRLELKKTTNYMPF